MNLAKNMCKVSVIVPNYNHAPFLEQRLDSILNQTHRDYELIILDDCSTDGSRDIIRDYQARFPFIRTYLNDRNSGSPCKQWDKGVLMAEGQYIWIAESDDFASPEFLEKMTPVLEKNRNIGLVCCDFARVDIRGQDVSSRSAWSSGTGERWRSDYINSGREEIAECLCTCNTIPNVSGVLFRKTSYIDAGLADAGMKYCGDWFFYLRLLLGSDIAYVADQLNFFRYHDGSTCNRYYIDPNYLQEVMEVYDFIIKNISLPSLSVRKIRYQISRHFCVSLKNYRLPEKSIRQKMMEIAPYFELYAINIIAMHMIKKFRNRFSK